MSKPGFSLLKHFGLTQQQIDELNDVVVGRMTVEGAPHLKQEHYEVFACSFTTDNLIGHMGHLKMMAAVQPFLSGAISKTVNLPQEATVDEVANIYEEGWRLGLKAVALYRDGCKASQPLSTSSKDKDKEERERKEDVAAAAAAASASAAALSPIPQTSAPQETTQLTLQLAPSGTRPHGLRFRLPKKRTGFTQEARVGGHKIFLRTGEYEDQTLGEIFIDMHKEGAAFRSLMNCFSMSVSIGLQYGVPLQTYVDQFTFTRFEPQGIVEGHPNVKVATSIVDYVFRVLGVEYLRRYDLAHIKPEEAEERDAPAAPPSVRPDAMTEMLQMQHMQAQIPTPLLHTREATARSANMAEGLEGRSSGGGGSGSPLDAQLDSMMGDAPLCDVCGHITVRNGACYKCLNCGNSMGCS
jgi:ribonucleoside-diphosphate reductase alpha chain